LISIIIGKRALLLFDLDRAANESAGGHSVRGSATSTQLTSFIFVELSLQGLHRDDYEN
jgi:hypothetical protein